MNAILDQTAPRASERPVLLVLGEDKISARAAGLIPRSPAIVMAADASTDGRRVWKLVRKGVITLPTLLKMAIADLVRPAAAGPDAAYRFRTNAELADVVTAIRPRCIVLFRAGLIVNRQVLDLGVPIHNIHCALVPEFGGIGSIARALKQRCYQQQACLHVVTNRIDEGEVLDREPYLLRENASYRENEDAAYAAGIALLGRYLRQLTGTDPGAQLSATSL